MARRPIVPPAPVAPPPRLVRLRCTTDEAALIVRTLRASPEGPAAHRLADVLQHEVVLTGRGRPTAGSGRAGSRPIRAARGADAG